MINKSTETDGAIVDIDGDFAHFIQSVIKVKNVEVEVMTDADTLEPIDTEINGETISIEGYLGDDNVIIYANIKGGKIRQGTVLTSKDALIGLQSAYITRLTN